MNVFVGLALAAVLGLIVGSLIMWVWPVRNDRTKAWPRTIVLLVAVPLAVLAMGRIGSELAMPGAALAAAIYFGVVFLMWLRVRSLG